MFRSDVLRSTWTRRRRSPFSSALPRTRRHGKIPGRVRVHPPLAPAPATTRFPQSLFSRFSLEPYCAPYQPPAVLDVLESPSHLPTCFPTSRNAVPPAVPDALEFPVTPKPIKNKEKAPLMTTAVIVTLPVRGLRWHWTFDISRWKKIAH